MPQTTNTLVDNEQKVIIQTSGKKNESSETLVDIVGLKNSSSDSSVSISDLHYAIEGTGDIQVFYENDDSKKITLAGKGVYPKPGETVLSYVKGNINITTDQNVNKYNIIIECQKREGFN